MLINGEKFACEACVRGHRVSSCSHSDRLLVHVSRKGRPLTGPQQGRGPRKLTEQHITVHPDFHQSGLPKEDPQRPVELQQPSTTNTVASDQVVGMDIDDYLRQAEAETRKLQVQNQQLNINQTNQSPVSFGQGRSLWGPSDLTFNPRSRRTTYDDGELDPTAIVIKNISFAVRKEQLAQLMVDLDLPLPYALNYHFDKGVFRGFASANYNKVSETEQVINALNDKELNGRKLRVEYKKMLSLAERQRLERAKVEQENQYSEFEYRQNIPFGRDETGPWNVSRRRSNSVASHHSSMNSSLGGGRRFERDYQEPEFIRSRAGSASDYEVRPSSPGMLPLPPPSRDSSADRQCERLPDIIRQELARAPYLNILDEKDEFVASSSESDEPAVREDDGDQEQAGGWKDSFEDAVGSTRLRTKGQVPDFVQAPGKKPEQRTCYICGGQVLFERSRDWQNHVLKDLRPYQCLEERCLRSDTTYYKLQHLKSHYITCHRSASILAATPIDCIFCGESLATDQKSRFSHLGRHMEEMSFTVIPKQYEDWDFYSESTFDDVFNARNPRKEDMLSFSRSRRVSNASELWLQLGKPVRPRQAASRSGWSSKPDGITSKSQEANGTDRSSPADGPSGNK